MYIERKQCVLTVEKERWSKISAGKRTLIDSIIDVRSEGSEWGCIHIDPKAATVAKQFR